MITGGLLSSMDGPNLFIWVLGLRPKK